MALRKFSRFAVLSMMFSITLLVSGLIASIAWFEEGRNDFKANVNGGVVESYFHCGSGTQADPFVITRPIHYYHLVEFFQRKTNLPLTNGTSVAFGEDYLYFQVGYPLNYDENSQDPDESLYVYEYDDNGVFQNDTCRTLNMAFYSESNVLMPIGTSACPFFGRFDGGASNDPDDGIVISNLHICCKETIGNTDKETSDAGVFGYVADQLDNSHKTVISNLRIDGLTIDLSDIKANTTTSSGVSHVTAHTDSVNVGYIVGHLHTYTPYNSSTSANSTPLHDVYVDNAKIEGGAGSVCNYGYIGLIDTFTGNQTVPSIAGEVAALNGNTGWGGSIEMLKLNQRLYSILSDTNQTTYINAGGKPPWGYYNGDGVSVSVGYGNNAKTRYANNPETTQLMYILLGDGEHIHKASGKNYTVDLPGTYIPIVFNNDLSPAEINTGYIVSETTQTTNGDLTSKDFTGNIRSASYQMRFISNSLASTTVSNASVYSGGTGTVSSYTASNLEVLTNNTAAYGDSPSWALIQDSYNASHTIADTSAVYTYRGNKKTWRTLNLDKYDEVRNVIHTNFNGKGFIHGIHFMNASISNAEGSYVTLTDALINGETIDSLRVPKNSIDFNLKTGGFVKCYAGSYYAHDNVSSANCFFSLHKITRSGASYTPYEIKQIYKNPDYEEDPTQDEFIYNTSNNYNKPDGAGDLVFDTRYITEDPPVMNALYYFQIPLNAGEYALGSVSGKTAGAYLMYLDIGANGNDGSSASQTVLESPLFTQIGFNNGGFVQNACFNIAFVVPAGATKEKFWITVSMSGTVYSVQVCNTTGNAFSLHVLLVDNDSNPATAFPYTYTLKYNTGSVSQAYSASASYTGTSGGTELTVATS